MYDEDQSILLSVKHALGLTEEYDYFDPDIIMHINSVLMILNQIGIGPAEGFVVSNENQVWTDITDDISKLSAIKSYVYLRVRLLFDPPSSSFVLSSMENQSKELEWRLNVMVDPKTKADTAWIIYLLSCLLQPCCFLSINLRQRHSRKIQRSLQL